MGSRSAAVILGGLVVLCLPLTRVVEGAKLVQCNSEQSCLELWKCSDFLVHFNKKYSDWPPDVQKEVNRRVCDKSGKFGKICCKPFTCGKQSDSRIAHGNVADVFAFPWMALLRDFDESFFCGGTLITKRHVLTAAHCLSRRQGVASVRLGENDLSKGIDCIFYDGEEEECAKPPQDIPVDKTIQHPQYSVSRKKNDIALIRLQRPATINHSVKVICLPLHPNWSRDLPKSMIVSGWGITEHGNQSNVLRFASVPLVEQNQCSKSYGARSNVITVDDTNVCAGGAANKQDNCEGDSGGPLQFFSDGPGGFVQHGIVAFGLNSCGKEAMPGVYTKVSSYLDWILANLK